MICITSCTDREDSDSEVDANARLIALSPDLYAFAAMIARMTQDGEEVDGEEFVMENDDAVATVNDLIDQARTLTATTRAEGWNLFDFDDAGLLHIERDDAAQIFASDTDAVEHVRLLAARGDQKALHAIQLHDLNQPKIDALRRNPVTTKAE